MKLKLLAVLTVALLIGSGILFLPSLVGAQPSEPVVLYVVDDATISSTGGSSSALWSWNAYDMPTEAEVFITLVQATPANTANLTIQTSPDNTIWVTHTWPSGRDVDSDTDAGVIGAESGHAAAGSTAYSYWNGPIHGRYFRVYFTLTGTSTLTYDIVAVLR